MVNYSSVWVATPADLEISCSHIDVWHCTLDIAADQINELRKYLSRQERHRADQFLFADKRNQFVCTRARLRQCLALGSGLPADEIEIKTDASGKPYLAGQARSTDIHFNISHTNGLALIAITRAQPVGIDVESVAQNVQHTRLAENYFSTREKNAIASLPPEQVPAAFFACWTRKEAVLKAVGVGFAHGLDSFDAATAPEVAQCQVELQSDDGLVNTWHIETLPCETGFAGALAYQKKVIGIRYWY